MTRVCKVTSGLFLVPLLVACDPKSGEDPSGDGAKSGGGKNGACGKVTVTELADLSVVPETFDRPPADMLADFAGTYEGTFTWRGNDGPVTVPWPGAASEITLTLSRAGSDVRLVEVADHGGYPNGAFGGQPCSNALEFDMQMRIETADGTLDELLAVTVHEYSINYGVPHVAHELDLDALDGDLERSDIEVDEGRLDRLSVYADFDAPQISGSLLSESSFTDIGGVLAGDIASFFAFKDGANSRCGACASGEYCYLEYDGDAEFDTDPAATCQPFPQACADTPTCECLTEALCPMQPGSCSETADVLTQSCLR